MRGTLLPRCARPLPRRSPRLTPRASPTDAPSTSSPPADYARGVVVDVDEVAGVRVVRGEGGLPRPEYLIRWKDGAPATWEPAARVADNLLRDWEAAWWAACRKGDVATVRKMLAGGGRVLACCVDENRRSGLHYAAGCGSAETAALLVAAGANVNLRDAEGFTPLHLAVGYSHTPVVSLLLDAGADPEVRDAQGRDVVGLVASLRASTPPAPELLQRRVALEAAAAMLNDHLFEEVEPASIVRARATPSGMREFLVTWPDGRDDSWVPETDVAQDVVADFDAGLEYAPAARLVRERRRGDGREFLVEWADGADASWEPEENVAADAVAAFDAAARARAKELAGVKEA